MHVTSATRIRVVFFGEKHASAPFHPSTRTVVLLHISHSRVFACFHRLHDWLLGKVRSKLSRETPEYLITPRADGGSIGLWLRGCPRLRIAAVRVQVILRSFLRRAHGSFRSVSWNGGLMSCLVSFLGQGHAGELWWGGVEWSKEAYCESRRRTPKFHPLRAAHTGIVYT